MARTPQFWPANLSFLGMGFVHHSNLAQTKISFNNSSASSFITVITLTSAQSQLMNSPVALGWWTIFSTGYLTKNTNLDWMRQCQVARRLGYSTKFTPILCTCVTQTARSFRPISLLPPRPQFRLSSMAPFAPAFLQRSGGSRHIPPTLNYARFVTSH